MFKINQLKNYQHSYLLEFITLFHVIYLVTFQHFHSTTLLTYT